MYMNVSDVCLTLGICASVYAEFESVIRELFKPQLDDSSLSLPESKFWSDDLNSLLELPTITQVGAACSPKPVLVQVVVVINSQNMIIFLNILMLKLYLTTCQDMRGIRAP